MKYIHIVQERTVTNNNKGQWSQKFFANKDKAIEFFNDRQLMITQVAGALADYHEEKGKTLYTRAYHTPYKVIGSGGEIQLMAYNVEVE